MKKFSSYKKLIVKKNESIDFSLKFDKYDYYNNYINKNVIKNNNSYSNVINLTNNNVQTNFTSSVNNTATSLTNNKIMCHKKVAKNRLKIIQQKI